MVDLAREQRLALLGFLALGDVHRDAADPHDLAADVVEARRRRARAPAHLAVGTPHAKLGLMRLAVLQQRLHSDLQTAPSPPAR